MRRKKYWKSEHLSAQTLAPCWWKWAHKNVWPTKIAKNYYFTSTAEACKLWVSFTCYQSSVLCRRQLKILTFSVLYHMEFIIGSFTCHQFFVSALLYNHTPVYYHNHIWIDNCWQAMCYHNAGAILSGLVYCLLNQLQTVKCIKLFLL